MRKLLICSDGDTASVNIRDALIASGGWEDDGNLLYREDMIMMTIPGMHIHAENIDVKCGIEEVIFLSKHKSASGIPTFTVHPIGNFRDADLGGKPRTLVRSSPRTMSALLRSLSSMNTGDFQVSFEVTHHGPWMDVPSTFIEIGSDEVQWNSKEAAGTVADAVLDHNENDEISVIGIGGGHYAPRFTEAAIGHGINFGHMIPEYAFRDTDEEELIRIIRDSAENSETKLVYVHANKETTKRIANAVASCGLEIIDKM